MLVGSSSARFRAGQPTAWACPQNKLSDRGLTCDEADDQFRLLDSRLDSFLQAPLVEHVGDPELGDEATSMSPRGKWGMDCAGDKLCD